MSGDVTSAGEDFLNDEDDVSQIKDSGASVNQDVMT